MPMPAEQDQADWAIAWIHISGSAMFPLGMNMYFMPFTAPSSVNAHIAAMARRAMRPGMSILFVLSIPLLTPLYTT